MSDRYRALWRLLAYLKPHWMKVAVGALLASAVAVAGGLIAWLVKPAMDDIFLKRDVHMLTLIPLALRGVRYRPSSASAMLRRNIWIYGLGGIILPFIGIKLIDLIIQFIPGIG